MKSSLGYKIGSFTDVNQNLRDQIWLFLNEQQNIQLMIDSSNRNRPAVEGIAQDLLENVFSDRVKKCVGFLIKQVMESNGLKWISKDHKVEQNPIFNKGSKYSK